MDAWFNLPIAGLFVILAIPYALIVAFIKWLAFHSPMHARVQKVAGIAPPLFAAIGVLFSLLTTFLANDIASRNSQAARAVLAEANALHDVRALSIASASDMADIRQALRDYAHSVLDDEWPKMIDDGRSFKTEAAFAELLRQIADPSIARAASQAVHSALLSAASRIGIARSERLAIAEDHTNRIKWLTVFALSFLTLVAIGLVHVNSRQAQLAALTLFACAAVVALALIAVQEQPFAGDVQVSPAPIQRFLDTMTTNS
jgi:hypothetical protein